MAKKNPSRRRLIISILLTMFFLGFILVNVAYRAGVVYLILSMISFIVISNWDKIPKKRPDRKLFSFQEDWFIDLLFGVFIGFIILMLMKVLPGFAIAAPSLPSATAFPTPLATMGQYLTVVGAASLVEEIFFRTVLFAVLYSVIGISFFWSAVDSSLIFSIYHVKNYAGEIAFNPILAVGGAFFSAFIIAVLIVYVNKWRGSVTTGMGVHSTINAGLVSGAFFII